MTSRTIVRVLAACAAVLVVAAALSHQLARANPPVWTSVASMAVPRASHIATLLPNGKVLVDGGAYNGQVGPPAMRNSAELYDLSSDVWANAGTPGFRSSFTATLLASGKVLVAGGFDGAGGTLATADLYDPGTNSWAPAAAMSTPRTLHTATLLPDGRVLVAGGYHYFPTALNTAEVYDPATNSWTPTGVMVEPLGRGQHAATLLPSGTVLITGGINCNACNGLKTAEIYHPASNVWTAAASMVDGRFIHSATLLADGRVLVAGGSGFHKSAEIYDPSINSWSSTALMNEVRGGHSATLLSNGTVLVVGGLGPDPVVLASSEIYDPALATWDPGPTMSTTRAFHTATLMPTGEVLVTGGIHEVALNQPAYEATNTVELYSALNRPPSTQTATTSVTATATSTAVPSQTATETTTSVPGTPGGATSTVAPTLTETTVATPVNSATEGPTSPTPVHTTTPTPTTSPPPVRVGGFADIYLRRELGAASVLSKAGPSATRWAMSSCLAAVALIAMGLGTWYFRRRASRRRLLP